MLCPVFMYMYIVITVGILRLQSFGLVHNHRQHHDFGLLLGSGVQETVVSVWRHTERALGLQIHLLLVVRILWVGVWMGETENRLNFISNLIPFHMIKLDADKNITVHINNHSYFTHFSCSLRDFSCCLSPLTRLQD